MVAPILGLDVKAWRGVRLPQSFRHLRLFAPHYLWLVARHASRFSMRTLLWIDDHVAGVTLRKPILENSGYSVLTATTSKQGLALVSSHPIDAVIIDCPLPDMSGELLARQLRAKRPTLPIVVLSRLSTGIPDGLAGLADATFTKALDPFSSLVAKLSELVPQRDA